MRRCPPSSRSLWDSGTLARKAAERDSFFYRPHARRRATDKDASERDASGPAGLCPGRPSPSARQLRRAPARPTASRAPPEGALDLGVRGSRPGAGTGAGAGCRCTAGCALGAGERRAIACVPGSQPTTRRVSFPMSQLRAIRVEDSTVTLILNLPICRHVPHTSSILTQGHQVDAIIAPLYSRRD